MEASRRGVLKLGAAITGVTAALVAGVNVLHGADASPGERRGDMLYWPRDDNEKPKVNR